MLVNINDHKYVSRLVGTGPIVAKFNEVTGLLLRIYSILFSTSGVSILTNLID